MSWTPRRIPSAAGVGNGVPRHVNDARFCLHVAMPKLQLSCAFTCLGTELYGNYGNGKSPCPTPAAAAGIRIGFHLKGQEDLQCPSGYPTIHFLR